MVLFFLLIANLQVYALTHKEAGPHLQVTYLSPRRIQNKQFISQARLFFLCLQATNICDPNRTELSLLEHHSLKHPLLLLFKLDFDLQRLTVPFL